ncbi:MAG: hypothetical protein KDA84_05360 [Planctomycetaceae bacterium]|nr:hypothetical protein [Planctomycetaceae bacterium]
MNEPIPLNPNTVVQTIDDSKLAQDSAKCRAHAEALGLNDCCQRLSVFGMNLQESWNWIRLYLKEVSFRDFNKAYDRELMMVSNSNLIRAIVKETAPGGAMLPGHRWRIETEDGRLLWGMITAKVRTLKVPTLQVGETVFIRIFSSDPEICSIDLSESPVRWVGKMKLQRMAEGSDNSDDDKKT